MEKVKKIFASLEEIYEANYRLIYVYICDYSVYEELVEEISSIVWEKVAEHSEDYLAKDDRWLKNSLRIIVRTTMADHFRREAAFNRAYEKLKEATERYGEDCSEEIFREDRKRYLAEALCILSEEEKLLINMRFVRRLTSREAAELLGISDGAVRMRQERILRKLRAEIERLENENGG